MRSRLVHLLTFAAISSISASLVACGGRAQVVQPPSTASIDPQRVGSSPPDPASSADVSPAAAPRTTAVSATDDGSDIIPPFPSSAPKKAPAKKPASKAAGRSKKKG